MSGIENLLLPYVGRARARRVDQGLGRRRLSLRKRSHLPRSHRRGAPLAQAAPVTRRTPVSCRRRALARPRRPAQYRRHERARLLLVLLRQRTKVRSKPPRPHGLQVNGYLYWGLHLVWLFPWSLFAPLAAIAAWRHRARLTSLAELRRTMNAPAARSILLLSIYSALILVFFSLSTNQEYYTFPAYLPPLTLYRRSAGPRRRQSHSHDSPQWRRIARRAPLAHPRPRILHRTRF